MTRSWRRAASVAMLWLATAGAAAAQQVAAGDRPVGSSVSGVLPGDHWAVEAVWRLEGMGWVRGFLPGQRAVPISVVDAALRDALASLARSGHADTTLVRGWHERFREEFPGTAGAGRRGALAVEGAALAAGYLSHSGREAPGRGEFPPNRTGALALEDLGTAVGAASVAATLAGRIGVQAAARATSDGVSLTVADLALGAGPWMLSAGRQSVGYGWAERGGLVLSGAPLDRVELATLRPIRLPLLLRHLGLAAGHLSFSRLPDERHPGRPYFWTARAALQPHPRFTVAVHRAAMFGGDSSDVEITPRTILDMLIGDITGGSFENQIVAVAGRLRLPTERVVPLTAYLEWGAEDAAGAWMDVPGVIVGLRAPAIPGAPEWSLGAEYARFEDSCCGNPEWYRHFGFPGSWSGATAPLGHPLGGHGRELSLHSAVLLDEGRARVQAEAFRRRRDHENLYVPGREGRSTGGRAEVAWRPVAGWEVQLSGGLEDGAGWRETFLEVGGVFHPNLP